jgi:hypothetical protein
MAEHFHRKVRGAEIAGACIDDLAGPLLSVFDKILHRPVWRRTRHDEKVGIAEHTRDRRELRHLVGRLAPRHALGFRQDRHRRQRHQHGVIIRLVLEHGSCAQRTARPDAVVDDNRLPQNLAQPQRQRTRRDVGQAAGRERHDDRHAVRRPCRLRRSGARSADGSQRKGCCSVKECAAVHRDGSLFACANTISVLCKQAAYQTGLVARPADLSEPRSLRACMRLAEAPETLA